MNEKTVCPGCSRHCTADKVCCRFGSKYFEAPPGKWKKCVTEGNALWKLIVTAKLFKKELRDGKVTENRLLSRLNAEEQQQLCRLLEKMNPGVLS